MSSRRASATGVLVPPAGALILAVVVVAAGCSADVSRFSLGGVGTTGAIPMPFAPTKTAYGPGPSGYVPPKGPPGYTPPPIETTLAPLNPLKDPPKDYRVVGRTYGPPPTSPPPHAPPPATFKPPAVTAQPPAPKQPPSAVTVEVQPGDTLFSIARRHGVTASAVKELNNLPTTSVRPGQRLVLPAEAKEHGPLAKADPPGKAAPPTGEATAAKLSGAKEPSQTLPPRVVQVKPRIIRAEEVPTAVARVKTAKRTDTATDAGPPPAVAAGKFRWPLRGKVIAAFGIQADGAKNEGVDVAAPLGTDVHAAEAGRVHYVGKLKGYGNLVLVRHANDWATAYGYVDQVLVKTNDEVKRGQVIAKVGKSGPASQPHLKFELRRASVPVDPLAHLPN